MMANSWTMIGALFGLFFGGAIVGHAAARIVAPESQFAAAIGAFFLPVAFALCMTAWYGIAVVWMVLKLPALLARKPSVPLTRPHEIPGSITFIPIAGACGLVAGTTVGIFAAGQFVWALLLFTALGLSHGILMRMCARRGLILPPEEL